MTDRPARILYVHHRPELGGAPQSLSYLIEHLDRTRFEPHVYCPGGQAAEAFERAGAVVSVGPVATFTHIWASTYRGRRWLLFLRELMRLPSQVRLFRRALKQGDFDLVHLNDSPLLPAAALARAAHLPVVWHLRSALPTVGKHRSAFMRRTIRALSTTTIAINEDVARSFDVGATIIPNAVDLERFRPGSASDAREKLGLDSRPVVAYFGFVYPSKGFREFIEAASLVKSRNVHAVYLIVGGPVRGDEFFRSTFGRALRAFGLAPDYYDEAKQLVSSLGLEDSIRFLPFTQDTPTLFRAADVIVAPSRGPELGRPVLEAAACGRVVVASGSIDGGGIILPDETGVIVPRRSPDSLAAALTALLQDDVLRDRMGKTAHRFAAANFDAESNAARVMELYDKVLAKR